MISNTVRTKQMAWPAEKGKAELVAGEDTLPIGLLERGLKWNDISESLPGRSALSCRLHYQNYLR
jgi:hypothetical protein